METDLTSTGYSEETEESTTVPAALDPPQLTIVGIGASAGGVTALKQFLAVLPADSGMAFVIIMHLAPDQESLLPDLLQRQTAMPVHQVQQEMAVEPNHIYVIPPGQRLLMTDSHIAAEPFTKPRGRRTPIDDFFRSLAAAHRETVAIILSGSGTDGSVGLKAIKEMDGLLLVQKPEEAEFDGMPRAAMVTGLVDMVLPVAELAQKLVAYHQHARHFPRNFNQPSVHDLSLLQRILTQVQLQTGHDLSQYQPATLLRRVDRRLGLHGFQMLEEYLNFLRNHTDEAYVLFNDLLVGVTTFFRAPKTWQALAEQAIPHLFANKGRGDHIRVWSIGCATGEEAYSLAMLLLEEMERHTGEGSQTNDEDKSAVQIQIFASDLDERALHRAREGLYPDAIEADLSPERLARFFVKAGNYYRIRRDLQDAVLFTSHNVLYDPPFSRIDLISSRNLLTHLQRPLRRTVLKIFHYALNPGGYLFLDNLDSQELSTDLFQVVDQTNHIYKAHAWPERPVFQSETSPSPYLEYVDRDRRHDRKEVAGWSESALESQHKQVLEAVSPPSLLVDQHHHLLHLSESVGRFLRPRLGPITRDLRQLIRPELQGEVERVLYLVFQQQAPAFTNPISVQFDGTTYRVIVAIHPYQAKSNSEPLALLFFLLSPEVAVSSEETPGVSSTELVQQLRSQLQYKNQQYGVLQEKLFVANEELRSLNEEYHVTIEELESNKEELYSINEELRTTNEELNQNLAESLRARNDIENLMAATDIPAIFLSQDLLIQQYTPAAKQIFLLQQSDLGRPVSHLGGLLHYQELVADARQVLKSLLPSEREVKTVNGRWLLARYRPYRTLDDRIEGAVLSFVDITEIKQGEADLRQSQAQLAREVASLQRLHQMTSVVVTSSDMQAALDEILNTSVEILNADFGNIQLLDSVSQKLIIAAQVNFKQPFLEAFRAVNTDDETSCGQALRLGHRVIIEDVEKDATYAPYLDIVHEAGYQAVQSTPLVNYRGEVLGILSTHYRQPKALIERDEQLLDLLAYQAANLLERLRTEDRLEKRVLQRTSQVRRLASELVAAEQTVRQRLAQNLHDDLQQMLYAVKVQVQLLEHSVGRLEELDTLSTMVAECLKLTRQLTVELSPPVLENEGLPEALSWLSVHMRELYRLHVTIKSSDHPDAASKEQRVLLYQIVRELLFNVVKHAEVNQAEILLEATEAGLSITVSDEGQGFDVAELATEMSASFGLHSIQERLRLFDGRAHIHSKPGEGTRVKLFLPNPYQK